MTTQVKKVIGYIKPVFVMCAFMLIIYGAYTPSQTAEIQQIVCVKFKKDVSPVQVQQYLKDFAQLRREIPQMVAYSAGEILNSTDFDVMHYVTFRKKEDISTFMNHPKYKALEAANKDIWEKTLVIDSKIEH